MKFYDRLQSETELERAQLMQSPLIVKCFDGDITKDNYLQFLVQAYHHVKHTTPLLMAAGSRMPTEKEWLRNALAEYIEEELGHQEWILNDIEESGGNKESVRYGKPSIATELMVSYAYDTINRNNPISFFGMVQVLEGTSIKVATPAAMMMKDIFGYEDKSFSYLLSHGSLDQDHIKFFEGLMNKIDDENDQQSIIHAAKVFYKLYGDVFQSVLANN